MDNSTPFVPVRLYSGGVLADGTTNTEPIDFLNPPPKVAPFREEARLAALLLQCVEDGLMRYGRDGSSPVVRRLLAAGVCVAPFRDALGSNELRRLQRQAHLAYLYLNVVECQRCHLPSAQGLVCPCGYDGTTDDD